MATTLCNPSTASSLRFSSSSSSSTRPSFLPPSGSCLRVARSTRFPPSPCSGRAAWAVESRRAKRMAVRCGGVKTVEQKEFASEVLESDVPVLVEFVADWCGPCRLITPFIEWASQEYSDKLKVVKIDHDANPELIAEYKVYGLPALILFKNGQEVPESRREGAITKVKLKEYLDSLLGSITAV